MVRQDVEIYHSGEGYLDLAELLPFLYLPHLESLRAIFPRESRFAIEWPTKIPPFATSLTRLHLRRSDIQPFHLGTILASTTLLLHLKCDLCCGMFHHGSGPAS